MNAGSTGQSAVIRSASPRDPAARALIAELDTYLTALYPPEVNYLLDVDALADSAAVFLIAEVEGEAVGCGAVVPLDGRSAELKRMYVRPAMRGRGIGRLLLAALEQSARERGFEALLLETGAHQPEAIALYQRGGYTPRAAYHDYYDDPLSLFMEKSLRADAATPAGSPGR